MAATIELRRARPDDADFMRELAQAAYSHYVERMGWEPGPMQEDYARAIRDRECWIAITSSEDEAPGQAVGYLVLGRERDHIAIDNVAVAPHRQGQGIGRSLLDFAEERTREEGFSELRLFTHQTMTENLAIYTARGYIENGQTDPDGFGRVFMTKQLL